ncbi:DUF2325 domain-containing protein [Caballeronia sp. Lep1P3]|uniref:DUF2325 domain-containing protein n=1 Tax=Caballeronia sp. Lep1P3 TaxID=2878150 RepID=UPI001FD06945|nr:DUF2325 domain-containing protein [Caballeronia sp. Lep1P3]
MQSPPFQLARDVRIETQTTRGHRGDACCQPSAAELRSARRRVRLAELDAKLHCSIIGTCLGTAELRKLVPKFANVDRHHASDLEIHHAAVELAIEGGAGAKALNKALDERYAIAIRRFDAARDAQAVIDLWLDALKSGDIAPAYWALMTHPHANIEVRQSAFGELHMLSHLVGAANRADIRRLVALEEENAALKDKIERQQARLQELGTEREAALRRCRDQALQLSALEERQQQPEAALSDAERRRLAQKIEEGERRLALHTSRREAAEQRAQRYEGQADALRAELDHAHALIETVQAECAALEGAALHVHDGDAAAARRRAFAWLNGRRIVYVGGRPNSNAVLKALVESADGDLIVHDGGIEDRKGLLAAALPSADIVMFPVDCIDHDSMNMLKRVCERHGVTYSPLRTASVASFVAFVESMARLDAPRNSPPPSAFCLRHG